MPVIPFAGARVSAADFRYHFAMWPTFFSLSLGLGAALAVEIVHITELDIYSSLAPCARSAV